MHFLLILTVHPKLNLCNLSSFRLSSLRQKEGSTIPPRRSKRAYWSKGCNLEQFRHLLLSCWILKKKQFSLYKVKEGGSRSLCIHSGESRSQNWDVQGLTKDCFLEFKWQIKGITNHHHKSPIYNCKGRITLCCILSPLLSLLLTSS